MPLNENDIKKLIKEEITKELSKNEEGIKKLMKEELAKQRGFTAFKSTDTPTDALSLVNRKFVTLSSNVGARPISSVAVVGQPFFATDTFIPMTYSAAGWRNGVGSIVAQNN